MKIILIALSLLVFSCASKPKATESSPVMIQLPMEEVIDVIGLQKYLKLTAVRLGFFEKSFNTCEVGFGYIQNANCRTKYMTVIRFQIMCRPEVSDPNKIISQSDLIPVADRNLNWKLNNITGDSETNHGGFGQLIAISSQSQKNQRLKINMGNDFLMMKSHEIDQVVTPPDWCH